MHLIDWKEVPKNSKGQVKYAAIPSVVVRVMVAEEELSRLQDKLNRHHDDRDPLRLASHTIVNANWRMDRLIRYLDDCRELLSQ